MGSWRCRWPLGCDLPVSLVEGRDRGLCYGHEKYVCGLIAPRPLPYRSEEEGRAAVALALDECGAPPDVVERALEPERGIPWGGRSFGAFEATVLGYDLVGPS